MILRWTTAVHSYCPSEAVDDAAPVLCICTPSVPCLYALFLRGTQLALQGGTSQTVYRCEPLGTEPTPPQLTVLRPDKAGMSLVKDRDTLCALYLLQVILNTYAALRPLRQPGIPLTEASRRSTLLHWEAKQMLHTRQRAHREYSNTPACR